jgi:hypothetical protein
MEGQEKVANIGRIASGYATPAKVVVYKEESLCTQPLGFGDYDVHRPILPLRGKSQSSESCETTVKK